MTETTPELNGHHDGLTPLQRRFVEFALDCGSAVAAYRKAGGKATTDESAWQQASALMRNHQVSRVLAELKAQRRQLTVADSAWIREKLGQVINRALQGVPVYDSQRNQTGVWRCDLPAANAVLRTLVALNIADPPPKADPATRDALKARIRMYGINTDDPYPEELDLMNRLGIDAHQARVLCDAEKMKQTLRARGIDADATASAANPGGPA
jgi:hypothetical protein